jgi:hypothetical protein
MTADAAKALLVIIIYKIVADRMHAVALYNMRVKFNLMVELIHHKTVDFSYGVQLIKLTDVAYEIRLHLLLNVCVLYM